MKFFPALILLLLGVTPARAHDPYEITSVAYVYSNRIELTVELEFPTAFKLISRPLQPDVAAVSQFEAALPALRAAAGGFFTFSVAGQPCSATHTNAEIGWEDHILLRLTYPPTPHRPLNFQAPGLKPFGGESPYGTTLTVLDMEAQKVLGQTTFFASTPAADFPTPTPLAETPRADPPETPAATTTQALTTLDQAPEVLPGAAAARPSRGPWPNRGLLLLLLLLAGAAVWWRCK